MKKLSECEKIVGNLRGTKTLINFTKVSLQKKLCSRTNEKTQYNAII